MAAQNKGKDLAIGAVVGGVVGAVAALLLAPKSGRELRGDIAAGCQTVSEKTQEIAKTVGSHTSEWFGKMKDAATGVAGEGRSWRESGRTMLPEEDDPASEAAEDLVVIGPR